MLVNPARRDGTARVLSEARRSSVWRPRLVVTLAAARRARAPSAVLTARRELHNSHGSMRRCAPVCHVSIDVLQQVSSTTLRRLERRMCLATGGRAKRWVGRMRSRLALKLPPRGTSSLGAGFSTTNCANTADKTDRTFRLPIPSHQAAAVARPRSARGPRRLPCSRHGYASGRTRYFSAIYFHANSTASSPPPTKHRSPFQIIFHWLPPEPPSPKGREYLQCHWSDVCPARPRNGDVKG